MSSDRLRGHLRALLLATLSVGPAHGYAVAQQLRENTFGLVTLREGSLYPALHRLEEEGLVASTWDAEGSGRRRRLYSLTAEGKEALRGELLEWREFRDAVDSVLDGTS